MADVIGDKRGADHSDKENDVAPSPEKVSSCSGFHFFFLMKMIDLVVATWAA